MKRFVAAISLLFLVGCASDVMRGYVGSPLTEPVLDYGPPAFAFDTGQGSRAFVWRMQSAVTLPGSASTTASAFPIGNSTSVYANTIINPPQTILSDCAYALYAERISDAEGPAAWRVTGFRKPRLGCE